MSLGVAFKAFFAALTNRQVSDRLQRALEQEDSASPGLPAPASADRGHGKAPESLPVPEGSRSEALTLLSTLQREARFLDLVQEPLDGFDDAQIGAAAREVLRDCKKTLDRVFAISSLAEHEEGAACEIEDSASPAKYRMVGKSTGTTGVIAHRGWQATQCEVPKWNGHRDEALILAPIEIQIT
jgi:hypothetical protein